MVLRLIIFCLVTLPTLSATVRAGEGVRLLYRLPANGTLYYDASSTLTQRFTMMQRPMETAVTTDLELRVSVVDKVLQQATVEVKYDYGRIRTRLTGMEDMPVQDTSVEIESIRDLRLQLIVLPNGEVTKSEILAAHPESVEVMAMLRSTRIFDRIFTPFPNHDVRPGEGWEVPMYDTTLAPQGLGQVITDATLEMTYQGIHDTLGVTCWVVDVSSSSLRQYGEFQRGDVHMDLDGDGTLVGRAFHDVITGAVVASRSTLESTVTMSFTGPQRTSVPVHSTVVLDLHQPRRER